jgi:hypothetical protein
VASDTADPETPPNTADPTTVTEASPPRKRCTNVVAKSIRFWPSWPLIIKLPARMKNGNASIGNDWVCWNICWATIISGSVPLDATAAPDAITRTCPTGTDSASSPKKTTMRTTIT